jgi:hypothetical protein
MLIWNVMGSVNFIVQMDPDMVSSYRVSEQAIIRGRPVWATLGFAAAVFGGALGCLLLMLKNSISIIVFMLSLAGVFATTVHTLGADINFSFGELIGIIVMPLAVAVFLVWYSKYVERKDWMKTK